MGNHADHVVYSSTALSFLTFVSNVNLHHFVQPKWKIGERQSLPRRN